MTRPVLFLFAGLVLSASSPARAEEPATASSGTREAGKEHLAKIAARPWGAAWKGAALSEVKKTGIREGPRGGLAKRVWHGTFTTSGGDKGYLMWDAEGEGKLTEFALDTAAEIKGEGAHVITGVPAQQQFPVRDKDGGRIASGCVPTAGGSLLGFWIARGQPGWLGKADAARPLADLTTRLRARLDMSAFPDTSGYTEDGLTLAGTFPEGLAKAIQADADENGVKAAVGFGSFRFDDYRKEIDAGRPVLLSCVVRLPHKPDLSWGHEMVGTGHAMVGGVEFVGVSDNFYPVTHPETVRWIAAGAMQTSITVRPEKSPEKEKDAAGK